MAKIDLSLCDPNHYFFFPQCVCFYCISFHYHLSSLNSPLPAISTLLSASMSPFSFCSISPSWGSNLYFCMEFCTSLAFSHLCSHFSFTPQRLSLEPYSMHYIRGPQPPPNSRRSSGFFWFFSPCSAFIAVHRQLLNSGVLHFSPSLHCLLFPVPVLHAHGTHTLLFQSLKHHSSTQKLLPKTGGIKDRDEVRVVQHL